MLTPSDLVLLRQADPKAQLPGINTQTGNPLSAASLESATSITKNTSAPYYYNPANNTVDVNQAGVVISGINFGSATLVIGANNVTVKDCSFSDPTGYYSVQGGGSYTTTVENCTFTGGVNPPNQSCQAFVAVNGTVENNSFIDAPCRAVQGMASGVITGNYIEGGGYEAGPHADAIWVNSANGVAITNNYIDYTNNPDAAEGTTYDIFVTATIGNCNNVTISGNYLFGGTYDISAASPSATGALSNVSIANNYLGFSLFGPYYPGTQTNATVSGNTIVDYTNPTYSTNAWASYVAAGVPTSNLVVSTGQNIEGPSSGSSTLYGAGYSVHMYGTANETNFVGGPVGEYMIGGVGANVFTFLSPGNSMPVSGRLDEISSFDPDKDVIDLSHIAANLTSIGPQSFTFIGTAPFTSAGAQVRYVWDTATDMTLVQVTLAGDMPSGGSNPDMEIELGGLLTLTAANFALTSAQSTADLAAGAALQVSRQPLAGGGNDFSYTHVEGKPYSSFHAFYASTGRVADALNLTSGAGELDLAGSGLTITRGGGTESLAAGAANFTVAYHNTETIAAGNTGNETFVFSPGFGNETVSGFSPGSGDTIQLSVSAFSYLNASMTQAQDLAAVLSHVSASSSFVIADAHGDALTLAGVSASTIAANPSAVRFV